MSGARIAALDGLRGMAALTVLLSHLSNLTQLVQPLGNGAGQLGVMLFFALSGFLMAHNHAGEPLDWQHAGRYATRRAARILPLYVLVIVVAFVFGLVTENQLYGYNVTTGNLLSHLMFIRGDGIIWTVPVEIQFYVLFLIIWALSHMPIAIYTLTIAAVILSLSVSADALPTLIRCLPYFLFGVTIRLISPPSKKVAGPLFMGALTLYWLSLPQMRPLFGFEPPALLDTWRDPLCMIVVCTLIWCAQSSSAAERLFGNSVTRWLGDISFSLYLLHSPLIGFLAWAGTPSWAVWLLGISGAVWIAAMSHVFIERPGGRLIRTVLLPPKKDHPAQRRQGRD
ncbi:acyltransferase family protein [Rhizobium sp. SGZ-381]|uniref:acyltransferase family protein n=1 Tax=Rhizobium sp. SGZ-381 TaxID=3342800 RepID=UPI003672A0C1